MSFHHYIYTFIHRESFVLFNASYARNLVQQPKRKNVKNAKTCKNSQKNEQQNEQEHLFDGSTQVDGINIFGILMHASLYFLLLLPFHLLLLFNFTWKLRFALLPHKKIAIEESLAEVFIILFISTL